MSTNTPSGGYTKIERHALRTAFTGGVISLGSGAVIQTQPGEHPITEVIFWTGAVALTVGSILLVVEEQRKNRKPS